MLNSHIDEDRLDRYAMGTLPKEQISDLEEHLLACSFCSSRLVETDDFVNVFRAAVVQVERRPAAATARPWAYGRILWAAAAASAGAMLILLTAGEPRIARQTAATVLMQSLRGPEAAAQISPGKPGLLIFDLPAAVTPFEVEIVDTEGKAVLTASPELRDGRLTAYVERLARGSYWVRVYRRGDAKELVAEYGLRAE